MENIVPVVVFVSFPIIGVVAYIAIVMLVSSKARKSINEGMKLINAEILASGFNVTRKVGYYRSWCGEASCFLYVDDVNKKWFISSPMKEQLDLTIRCFSDFYRYDFFDVDSDIWARHKETHDKLTKAIYIGVGALSGFILGRVIGNQIFSSKFYKDTASIGGAIGGGVGMGKLHDFIIGLSNDNGGSGGYGLALETSDRNNENPVICNFLDVGIKGKKVEGINVLLHRNTSLFKKDLRTIQEMGNVFNDIIKVNMEN